MIPRFHVPDLEGEDRIVLPKEESRHALRVLRLRPGAQVLLFDGVDREAAGYLEEVEEGRAVVTITSRETVLREPPVVATLAVAVPKGRRMEDLVRACAELGAHEVIPMWSKRTVVREREGRKGREERLRRVSVEASKQSERNRVTEVGEPKSLDEVLEAAEEHDVRLIATTEGGAVPLREGLGDARPDSRVLMVIGPEGGFEDDEIEAAKAAGLACVTLGRPKYRVETAAVAAMAMLVHHFS